MKAITEFPNHILLKGLETKAALAAEGKSEEEVQTSIGEAFKYQDEKLKYFMTALDVADKNRDKLSRVRVISFAEGETIPPKATKVDEHHYLADQIAPVGTAMKVKPVIKQSRGNKDRDKKGASPWGHAPEDKSKKETPKA